MTARAFTVGDTSSVSEARRQIVALSKILGLNETEAGRTAIVTTELATNMLKHGGGGELLAAGFTNAEGSGLQLLALIKARA